MVEGMTRPAPFLERMSGGGGGHGDGAMELLGSYTCAATALHEPPAGLYEPDGEICQTTVGAEGALDVVLTLSERRRVDDDDVELLTASHTSLHVVESIGDDSGDGAGLHRREVRIAVEVATGDGEGRCAEVDGGDPCRASRSGVDGETAGRGEHVENRAALATTPDELGHHGPVVALIEEVPRLLAVDDIGLESEPVLEKRHRLVGSGAEESIALLESVQSACVEGASETQYERRRVPEFVDRLGDVREVRDPRGGVHLEDHRGVVAVEDETGHRVAFAVDESDARGVAAVDEGLATISRSLEAAAPEGPVDGGRCPVVQDPDAQGARRVEQADGDELALGVEDHGEIARVAIARDRGDGVVVDPGVPGPDVTQGVGGDAHGEARR